VPLRSVNSNGTEKVLTNSYFYPFIFNQVKLSLYIYTYIHYRPGQAHMVSGS